MKKRAGKFSLFSLTELIELRKVFRDSPRNSSLNTALWEKLEEEIAKRCEPTEVK